MTRVLPTYLKSIVLVAFLITYCDVNAQWVEKNNGLWGGQINTLLADGNNLFAGTAGGGIYLSTDKGENWARRNDDNVVGYQVYSIWKWGKNLYSGSSGLCLSTDDGVTWKTLTYAFGTPHAIVSNDQNIFVGTQNGLFVSTDQGSNWASVKDNQLKTANVYSLAINGSYIFAGTGSGMFVSSDNGMNWQPINNGLNTTPSGHPVTSIVIKDTFIFAGTNGDGVFRSDNNGLTWSPVNNGLSSGSYLNITSLLVIDTSLFAAMADGVFLSTNYGASWSKLKGSPSYSSTLAVIGSSLFVGTEDVGVVLTNDIGTSWKSVNNGLGFTQILSINSNSNNLLAGTSRGIYRSQDSGENWALTSSLWALRDVNSFAISESNIFAGTLNNGVYRSADNGASWVSVNTGLTNLFVRALIFKEKTLFAATAGGGVFRSNNNGLTWTAVNNGLTDTSVLTFAIVENNLFVGTFGGVFVSSDNGTSWQPMNNGLISKYVFSLTSLGNKLFAGTWGGGVFQTIDNGNNWTPVDIGSSNKFVNVLFADGKIIYAGLTAGAILSYDQGVNWIAISDKECESIYVKNGYLFSGLVGRGIWSRPLTDFKFEQTITFNTLPSKTFGDSPFVLSASASSGLPLTYTSSDPTVASISGNTVTILKVGSATIKASQAGNDNYNPAAEVQQTLIIGKATPNITWSNPSEIVYGTLLGSTQLNATSLVDGTFAYTPASGTKLNAGNQNLLVTFTPTDAANYTSATKQVAIDVSKATPNITWSNPSEIVYGTLLGSTQLNATASIDGSLTYTPAIGAILNAGNSQTLSVTLKPADEVNYNSINKQVFINVAKANQAITFSEVAVKTFGDISFALIAASTSTLPISYSSSNVAVATISGNTLTINGAGTTIIIASQAGNNNYNAATDVTRTLTVNKKNQEITFTTVADKTLGDGTFNLIASSNSNLPVSFATTSDKITLSQNQVTLVKPGRVIITASQNGNDNYNAASAVTKTFCVNPPKPTITVTNLNTDSPILTSSASLGNQWYLGGTPISNGINATLTAAITGVYKVQVKIDDCLSEFSAEQKLVVTGDLIADPISTPIIAYPNPTKNILTIDLGTERGKKEVTIIDLSGRNILAQQTEGSKTDIDVSEYTRGLYIIKVQTTLRKSILRFEKQ